MLLTKGAKHQINRYNGGKNGVLQFILSEFNPASPHHGRFEGQLNGNHFTLGITVYGFKQALVIMLWATYKRDLNHFAGSNGECWNTGDHNGYDLCEHIRAYMHKIGKPQLSLIEAIMSGEVEELLCLQSEVGLADGFFSHVQAEAVSSTVQTLESAEERFKNRLLEDKAAVLVLRKKVLEDFCRQQGLPKLIPIVVPLLKITPPAQLEEWLVKKGVARKESAPALASITVKKKHMRPRFFVDYFNIRQCVKNDFATDRLVDAIDTIGVTVAELGTDFRDQSALLKRAFCVLELFATIKTKGELLVCGPALDNLATTMELAALASDKEQRKEVMDSSSSRTRSAEAEAEIKAYIKRTVGFERIDRVVLSVIVASACTGSAQAAFDEMEDRGSMMLHAAGCMLLEVGDFPAAQVHLHTALGKGEVAYGEGAFETEETVYMLGQCHRRTDGMSREWFDQSLKMSQEKHSAEHVATARSLVGIAVGHLPHNHAEALALSNLAIARIKAVGYPSDYTDVHADALEIIGSVHYNKQEWKECIECLEQSVQMRMLKHGPDHYLLVSALESMGDAYGELGDLEKQIAFNLQALGVEEKAGGRLSSVAGRLCMNIGADHWSANRHSEAAGWYKRAIEANDFTHGSDFPQTEQWRQRLGDAIRMMDHSNGKTKEYKQFLRDSRFSVPAGSIGATMVVSPVRW
jgi:tetratricopeptide (TPR) repeat protein